jgi:hypothetical protein
MFLSQWARKGLHNGDLSAILELGDSARWGDPSVARIAASGHAARNFRYLRSASPRVPDS